MKAKLPLLLYDPDTVMADIQALVHEGKLYPTLGLLEKEKMVPHFAVVQNTRLVGATDGHWCMLIIGKAADNRLSAAP